MWAWGPTAWVEIPVLLLTEPQHFHLSSGKTHRASGRIMQQIWVSAYYIVSAQSNWHSLKASLCQKETHRLPLNHLVHQLLKKNWEEEVKTIACNPIWGQSKTREVEVGARDEADAMGERMFIVNKYTFMLPV